VGGWPARQHCCLPARHLLGSTRVSACGGLLQAPRAAHTAHGARS
jgi:hypothetical protein